MYENGFGDLVRYEFENKSHSFMVMVDGNVETMSSSQYEEYLERTSKWCMFACKKVARRMVGA